MLVVVSADATRSGNSTLQIDAATLLHLQDNTNNVMDRVTYTYAAAHTDIYTLSLPDALPLSHTHTHTHTARNAHNAHNARPHARTRAHERATELTDCLTDFNQTPKRPKTAKERKSTRLNARHSENLYAVFGLKKKKKKRKRTENTTHTQQNNKKHR